MGKLKELVDTLKPALELIKDEDFTNRRGVEERYLNQVKQKVNNFTEKDFQQNSDTQAEMVKVFFEKYLVPSTIAINAFKNFCRKNPEFKKAIRKITDNNIFSEKNNNYLEKRIIGQPLPSLSDSSLLKRATKKPDTQGRDNSNRRNSTPTARSTR